MTCPTGCTPDSWHTDPHCPTLDAATTLDAVLHGTVYTEHRLEGGTRRIAPDRVTVHTDRPHAATPPVPDPGRVVRIVADTLDAIAPDPDPDWDNLTDDRLDPATINAHLDTVPAETVHDRQPDDTPLYVGDVHPGCSPSCADDCATHHP